MAKGVNQLRLEIMGIGCRFYLNNVLYQKLALIPIVIMMVERFWRNTNQ